MSYHTATDVIPNHQRQHCLLQVSQISPIGEEKKKKTNLIAPSQPCRAPKARRNHEHHPKGLGHKQSRGLAQKGTCLVSFHQAGIRVARLMLQDTAGCKQFQEILDKKVEGTRSVGQHSQTSSLPFAAHGCSLQGCSLQAPAQPPLCLYPGGPTGARRALREGRRSKKER